MIENDDLDQDEKGVEKLLESVKEIAPPDVFKSAVACVRRVDMDDPENNFGPTKYSPYDDYVRKMATQRQSVPPAPRVTAPPAHATSSNGNTGPKPKPLVRATYEEKLAMAEALTDLQAPSTDENANGKTRQKAKPRTRVAATVEENEDETDVEEDGTEGSGESSDGEADEENKPRTAASQAHAGPSSPNSEKGDGEDADDENESPVKAKKRTRNQKEDQAPNNVFDDFYADEENMCEPTPGEVETEVQDESKDENENEADDSEEGDEDAEETPASQTAATFVIWNDGDCKTGAEKKTRDPKPAPWGPKRMPSSMPSRNLKRDRDERDNEYSEGSNEENDENEDSWMPSKKRRVSGYYGANDENAPVASASQAEVDRYYKYETDEPSGNRPLSPTSERPSSEEHEDEEIETILSCIEDSPAGSPEPTGDTSLSVHLNGFDDDDVEMSDESEEDQNENTAPAPPAATSVPALALLLPSPLIVPSVQVRRARPLRRDEVTVVGNRRFIYGRVFEGGEEV